MKVFFTLLFVWLLGSTALWGQPADVVWNSQSGIHPAPCLAAEEISV